jgi:hypothetical protein
MFVKFSTSIVFLCSGYGLLFCFCEDLFLYFYLIYETLEKDGFPYPFFHMFVYSATMINIIWLMRSKV